MPIDAEKYFEILEENNKLRKRPSFRTVKKCCLYLGGYHCFEPQNDKEDLKCCQKICPMFKK